jgi:hypothetical protein
MDDDSNLTNHQSSSSDSPALSSYSEASVSLPEKRTQTTLERTFQNQKSFYGIY